MGGIVSDRMSQDTGAEGSEVPGNLKIREDDEFEGEEGERLTEEFLAGFFADEKFHKFKGRIKEYRMKFARQPYFERREEEEEIEERVRDYEAFRRVQYFKERLRKGGKPEVPLGGDPRKKEKETKVLDFAVGHDNQKNKYKKKRVRLSLRSNLMSVMLLFVRGIRFSPQKSCSTKKEWVH